MKTLLESIMGVIQGCSLSPTQFGLSLDQLVEFIQEALGEHEKNQTMAFSQYCTHYVLSTFPQVTAKSLDAVHTF
mgnify:CR=1 FL=1